jgi:hypothetical protein
MSSGIGTKHTFSLFDIFFSAEFKDESEMSNDLISRHVTTCIENYKKGGERNT